MCSAPATNLLQNSTYVGINLEDILYGVELVLYFMTMHALLGRRGEHTRSNIFYAIFSSVMLLIITVWVSVKALFGQKMWVLDANFLNGPDTLWETNMWNWYMDMAEIALIVLQLMTDGLMVYRCWAIWNSYRAIVIPWVLWTGAFVLGTLASWTNTVRRGFDSHDSVVRLNLAYYTISVFLTALLTCMICYRLLRHGRLMQAYLGHEYASTYFAIVLLVVESVLPHTLSGIAFLVSLGVGSQTGAVFGYIRALTMCISTQMLILRVAMKASRNETVMQLPSMVEFSPMEGTTSEVTSKVSGGLCAETSGLSSKGDDSMA